MKQTSTSLRNSAQKNKNKSWIQFSYCIFHTKIGLFGTTDVSFFSVFLYSHAVKALDCLKEHHKCFIVSFLFFKMKILLLFLFSSETVL